MAISHGPGSSNGRCGSLARTAAPLAVRDPVTAKELLPARTAAPSPKASGAKRAASASTGEMPEDTS